MTLDLRKSLVSVLCSGSAHRSLSFSLLVSTTAKTQQSG